MKRGRQRKKRGFISIKCCGIGIIVFGLVWTLTFIHLTGPKNHEQVIQGNNLIYADVESTDPSFDPESQVEDLKGLLQVPKAHTEQEGHQQEPEKKYDGAGAKKSQQSRKETVAQDYVTPSAYGVDFSPGTSHNPKNIFAPSDEEFQEMYPVLHEKVMQYKQRHNEAFEACRSGKGVGNYKMIVLDNHSGMGNQMLSHVSAFLLALLTNSVLVVKGNTYSLDIYADPGFDMRHSSWSRCGLRGSKSTFDLTIQKNSGVANKMLCTDFVNGAFASTGVYTIRGNVYFAPYFQFNKYTRDNVHRMFTPSNSQVSSRYTNMKNEYDDYYSQLKRMGISFNQTLAYEFSGAPELDMAAPLSRYILKPHQDVFKKRNEILSQYYGYNNGSHVTHVVGVQMRTDGHDVFVKEDETWRRFARCGHLETFLKHSSNDITSKMFIATDTEDARKRTERIYNAFRSPLSKQEVNFRFSSSNFLLSNTNAGKQEAVLDLLMLSEADELVITPRSTFGYWAAAWGGHRPLMIHHWITPAEVEKHRKKVLNKSWKEQTFFMGIPNTGPHGDMKYCVRRQSFEPVIHPIDQMKLGELSCHAERISMVDDLMFHGRYW
mmetsp:Transcript_30338/g.38919  ORF Transcript_30338/g.38919 Transcript_30338/m.38919 type:complete len:603 (-) Transcript_30338:300-2108(-)